LGKLFTHIHTHLSLSPNSIIWYQSRGSDVLRLVGNHRSNISRVREPVLDQTISDCYLLIVVAIKYSMEPEIVWSKPGCLTLLTYK